MRSRGFAVCLFFCTGIAAQTPAHHVPFQVHGYVQGRFTDQEGTSGLLEVRRARVLFTGVAPAKVEYVFQVDIAKRPYLMDLSLTRKFSKALSLTAGQFKIPFSSENLVADNLNIPVARARAVLALAPGRDTGVQGRDTGLKAAGEFRLGKRPSVEYAAGIFRGQTLIYAPGRHYRAVVGRVMVHPIEGLAVGGDWYRSFSAAPPGEKRREEVEGSYVKGRLRLRAEQIWARDGALERKGGYALGAWELSRYWEPLLRADWLTTDIHKPNSTSIAYVAGVNFRWRNHVKIGLNTGAQHNRVRGFTSVLVAQTMLMF